MSKIIVLTGGGTAGHVMPNLALLPYLRDYFDEFHYIGSSNGVEKSIISEYSFIKYHEIPTIKLIRSLSLKNLKIPFVLLDGTKKARKLLREIKPDIIFSKGGYVALPVVRAAGKIPVICHESDMSIGLANRLSIKKCDYVCTSFEDTAKGLKNGVHTGAPIRNSLYAGRRLPLTFNNSLPVLLVMGGSLGAKAINECLKNSLNLLLKKYNIIHIAGKGHMFASSQPPPSKNVSQLKTESHLLPNDGSKQPSLGKFYQYEFVSNIEDYYKTADLVVSRGGAGSMFELMALAKRALIIPLPKGNSRGDQVENAKYFSARGCCHILEQEKLSTESLIKSLEELQSDRAIETNIQNEAQINGTKAIAALIKTTTQNKNQ